PRGAVAAPGDPRADEREPLNARGMHQRVRDGDGAAEGVADQRRGCEPEPVEEAAERAGEVRQAIARARLGRGAESGKVDGVDRRAPGQGADIVSPRLREAAEAVHEDDRGAATFDHIVEAEPVDLAATKLHFRHGNLILYQSLR